MNLRDPSGKNRVDDVVVTGLKNPCRGVCIDLSQFQRLQRYQDGGSGPSGGSASPRETERRCIAASDGPVYLGSAGLDLNIVAGGGFGFSRFTIPSIGAEGWAFTGTGSGGVGGSVGVSGGVIDTVGQWIGKGYRFEFALGPVSLNLSFDNDGKYSGLDLGAGAGGGVYGGVTKTKIKSSNMPLCEEI